MPFAPLPPAFQWLADEPGPKLLLAALQDYGLREVPGAASNPRILNMAREVGAAAYYTADAIPWCALALSAWVRQAGFALPRDPLRALSWATWGNAAPKGTAMLGDVLVMGRQGGGHVTLYCGETKHHFWGLGANQGNTVNIVLFPKARISHVRRCRWRVAEPANVRRVWINAAGPVSQNEA